MCSASSGSMIIRRPDLSLFAFSYCYLCCIRLAFSCSLPVLFIHFFPDHSPLCVCVALKLRPRGRQARPPRAAQGESSPGYAARWLVHLRVRINIQMLLEVGGFKLLKWLSNSQAVMNTMPREDSASVAAKSITELELTDNSSPKSLGL